MRILPIPIERITARVSDTANPMLAEPPLLEEIQQIAASQNTTLVQYSWVDGRPDVDESLAPQLYIWVVKPTGEITLRQGDLTLLDRPLVDLVTLSRESIGARGRAIGVIAANPFSEPNVPSASENLQQLHRLLIDPIADLLPTDPAARVTIIPHQALFLVPFPALQASDGSYLIDRHTLLSGPSIQVLGLTDNLRQASSRAPDRQDGSALVVGNPTMPVLPAPAGESAPVLADLPGAEREARAIAALLNTTALIGDQATEPAVVEKMQQAHTIHLATHGLLDWGDPQALYQQDFPGAVALAPTQDSDGLLTAAEILDLDLEADLVILSACDTGQGRITGDGVIGLSRSLMVAGVPSVVVSLWAVPDAPTASLMTEFYRQLDQGQDKAQALRQAMLATRAQHPNPLDWAAFTLIGEAD
ncbi:MAG: CHAT domain-containing protein [Cyanobacteria bacterium P01_A01_bin.123]